MPVPSLSASQNNRFANRGLWSSRTNCNASSGVLLAFPGRHQPSLCWARIESEKSAIAGRVCVKDEYRAQTIASAMPKIIESTIGLIQFSRHCSSFSNLSFLNETPFPRSIFIWGKDRTSNPSGRNTLARISNTEGSSVATNTSGASLTAPERDRADCTERTSRWMVSAMFFRKESRFSIPRDFRWKSPLSPFPARTWVPTTMRSANPCCSTKDRIRSLWRKVDRS
mmetsp:Transcript_27180/g.74500  ORF Transcript_27180/g.74500 Transcript_27180/m.74500 type:complete len:226 (-) Transcript_27180:946-1623(-)